MTSKRIVRAGILCFAAASLLFPRLAPVQVAETTALLLACPWEALAALCRCSGLPSDDALPPQDGAAGVNAAPAAGMFDDERIHDCWWRPVFDVPVDLGGRILLGGRVCSSPAARATSLRLDMGRDPPVRRGDPVLHGGALVGFLGALRDDGVVDVLLLTASESPLVAAETDGGIAGGKIYFVAGGGFAPGGGDILLRFPSTRFGLTAGVKAYTSSRFNRDRVPAGLFLGHVSVAPDKIGQPGAAAGILPAVPADRLCRLAVLVPPDRPGAAERPAVPPLGQRTRDASLALPPGRFRPGVLLRVSGGIETGTRNGDLVLADGFLAGRVNRAGLGLSTAELLLAPESALDLVWLKDRGSELVHVLVEARCRSFCRLKVEPPLDALQTGSLLFLPGEACAGAELHPVCRVVDPGEGAVITAACGAAAEPKSVRVLMSLR